MTALMRNGRDRRSGTPVTSAMRDLSACFWLGPDQRITSGPAATAAAFKGRIHGCTRPHSLKCPIFPLHRGRRPYMALTNRRTSIAGAVGGADLLQDVRLDRGDVGVELLQLFAGQRADRELSLLRLNEEFRILHRGVEGAAQGVDAVLR